MLVNVLLFGPARDALKKDQVQLSCSRVGSVGELRTLLSESEPRLRLILTKARLAVNRTFVSDETVIREGDEVAVIPPVSGG